MLRRLFSGSRGLYVLALSDTRLPTQRTAFVCGSNQVNYGVSGTHFSLVAHVPWPKNRIRESTAPRLPFARESVPVDPSPQKYYDRVDF